MDKFEMAAAILEAVSEKWSQELQAQFIKEVTEGTMDQETLEKMFETYVS